MTTAAVLGGGGIFAYGIARLVDLIPDVALVDAELAPRAFHPEDVDMLIVYVDATNFPAAVAAASRTSVLAFVQDCRSAQALALLAAGARAVLPHSTGVPTFVTALRRLAQIPAPGHVTSRGAARTCPADVTQVPSPDPTPKLSERESAVLRLVSAGLTHQQVARRLGITANTVDTYVKRIRAKWGLGNKADLVRAALWHSMA